MAFSRGHQSGPPGVKIFKIFEKGDSFDYKYSFHSSWLRRILYEKLPWEDFFLSLRFISWRAPDIYNDHLLGLLKFNDELATHAVEVFEKHQSDETLFVTTTDGKKYEGTLKYGELLLLPIPNGEYNCIIQPNGKVDIGFGRGNDFKGIIKTTEYEPCLRESNILPGKNSRWERLR